MIEQVQRDALFCFCLKLFVDWQCASFAQCYDGSELKKGSSCKRL